MAERSTEERLRDLEDRFELLDIEGAYARTFDNRDGDAWSALFTPDGIYQSRTEDGETPAIFVQGTEALREFCTHARFNGIHFLHLPHFAIDGDGATARIHLEFRGEWLDVPGRPLRHTIGYYDVAYRRVEGRWRIARRVTSVFARIEGSTFGYPPGSGIQ